MPAAPATPERTPLLNEPAPGGRKDASHAKMVRGLRVASKKPLYPELSVGYGLPQVGELETLSTTARELCDSLRKTAEIWDENYNRRRNDQIAKMDSMLDGLTDGFGDSVPVGTIGRTNEHIAETRVLMLAKIDSDLKDVRELIAFGDKDSVDERLARLHATKRKLETFKQIYPTPLDYLTTVGLDDPRRSIYASNLAALGPRALETMLKHAIAADNKVLAACIAARVGELSANDRPFSAAEIADKVVGETYAAFEGTAVRIALFTEGSEVAVREFLHGPSSDPATDKIKRGLAELALTEPTKKLPPVPANKPLDMHKAFEQHLDSKYPAVKGSGQLKTLPASRTEAESLVAAAPPTHK